jgi:hypothetical protein
VKATKDHLRKIISTNQGSEDKKVPLFLLANTESTDETTDTTLAS